MLYFCYLSYELLNKFIFDLWLVANLQKRYWKHFLVVKYVCVWGGGGGGGRGGREGEGGGVCVLYHN